MSKKQKDPMAEELEAFEREAERQKKGGPDKRKQGRKPLVVKKGPNAPVGTKPKAPFALRTMRVNEEGKYGLDVKADYEDLDKMLKVVEKAIEDGQGNGLHEIVIVVR